MSLWYSTVDVENCYFVPYSFFLESQNHTYTVYTIYAAVPPLSIPACKVAGSNQTGEEKHPSPSPHNREGLIIAKPYQL
jgi:hypothetical protein